MDAAQIIEHYESVLGSFGRVTDFSLSSLDRLGVPVTSCSLIADGRFAGQGNGYGSTSDAARIGGLGELAEGVLLKHALPGLRRSGVEGSSKELARARGVDAIADPRTLGLPAGSAYDDDMPLSWIAATRVRTGETVYVPADFVVSEPADVWSRHPLIPPVTNGLGAGLDTTRAIAHGIGEVLQRHTNGLRFRALDRLSSEIDEATLPASVRELAREMSAAGVTPVFKHAGTELGVCSTYVMGLDDDDTEPIRLTACGEAAHPSAEVSVTKALLEFANSRARKAFFFGRQTGGASRLGPPEYWDAVRAGAAEPGERRAREAMQSWATRDVEELRALTAPARTDRVAFTDIEVEGVPDVTQQSDLLRHLLDAIDGSEPAHDVLAVSTTRDGVSAAKVLITNLEVEILSYGRIGELGVRRALDSDLGLVSVQDDPTASHPDRVALTDAAEKRLGGRVYYSPATAARIIGDLYPLYREPPRHSVVV